MKITYFLSFTIFCTIFSTFLLSNAVSSDYTLELLIVIFRHGDRSGNPGFTQNDNPYVKIFKEYGYAQLTTTGMKREYQIGQILRKRYNDFLGEYRPEEVYAYSTDNDRTKMSLQLVLAGLYPPSPRTLWNDDIHWSPAVTFYDPDPTNFLATIYSEKFIRLVLDAEKSPEYVKRLEKYHDFLERLKNIFQISEINLLLILNTQQNIRAALSMGLPLPDWCSKSDYEALEEITGICFDTLTYSEFMTKVSAGPTIERFLKNINDTNNSEIREKIYLYSAHDFNIACLERAHKFADFPAVPDYGSTIIIEKLKGPCDQDYVRMLLWTGAGEQLFSLKIKNSTDPCLLSEYVNFISWTLPDDKVREFIGKDY